MAYRDLLLAIALLLSDYARDAPSLRPAGTARDIGSYWRCSVADSKQASGHDTHVNQASGHGHRVELIS